MKGLIRMLMLAACGAVIYEEAKKPIEERNWHGKALGFLPYDFRLPGIAQLREAYWNPASERILTERPLGIGWAVNFGVLARYVGIVHVEKEPVDFPRAA